MDHIIEITLQVQTRLTRTRATIPSASIYICNATWVDMHLIYNQSKGEFWTREDLHKKPRITWHLATIYKMTLAYKTGGKSRTQVLSVQRAQISNGALVDIGFICIPNTNTDGGWTVSVAGGDVKAVSSDDSSVMSHHRCKSGSVHIPEQFTLFKKILYIIG